MQVGIKQPERISPRNRAANAAKGLLFAGVLLALGACAGSGGGGGSGSAVGSVAVKSDGSPFIVDPNQAGQATRLQLTEITWGRLVDVHDLDALGNTNELPIHTEMVINENVQTDAGRYELRTNPITSKTRLIIQRERGAPSLGGVTFDDLLRAALDALPPILPKGDDGTFPGPFSFMSRNGCLSLRFNDALDDSATEEARLVQTIRVIEGYAPDVRPFITRIFFDPNHGVNVNGSFHSTRVLVDFTVSEAELGGLAFSAQLNSTGLPASQEGRLDPNVSLRIATVADQQTTFFVLRGLSGGQMALVNNGPVDPLSSTQDVVRAFRSGSKDDANNGFLVDSNRPQIVGAWNITIENSASEPGGDPRRDFLLDVLFNTACQSRLQAGDSIEAGLFQLEVVGDTGPLTLGRASNVRVRALNSDGLNRPDALLGSGSFLSPLDPDLGLPDACWVSFIPEPTQVPATGVSTTAQAVFRFTEPMDLQSINPFDSFVVQRGGANAGVIVAENLVVGNINASQDQKSFFSVPEFPFSHVQGQGELYHIRLEDVTDLAGNPLLNELAAFDFSIDANDPSEFNGGVSFRFSALDEISAPVPILNAENENDLRGQFLINTTTGILRPRGVTFTDYPADRNSPLPSIMIPFARGIQTPLSPFGSKLQSLWRYVDFGFLPQDETRFNLDVIGLAWAPIGGRVVRDSYPEFEIRLAHSRFLPDERVNVNLLPQFITSGLRNMNSAYTANILNDPLSPQKIVHARSLGYEFSQLDRFTASSGTLMVPYPLNRVGEGPLTSYTWRDNAVLAIGGAGGGGVPVGNEIGPPLNIFPTGTPKIWRPSNVPSVCLPLLIEYRCFPSTDGLGLNSLDISLAINSSIFPNFRAFSTGGVNRAGVAQEIDPGNEPRPTGGYNPTSTPPGARTAFGTDNTFYIGQMDTVIRVSRAHTVWVDTRVPSPDYALTKVLPDPGDQPPGTEVILEYRGATGFVLPAFMEELPFVADNFNPYGEFDVDPSVTADPFFFNNKKTWTDDLDSLDSAQFFQIRITFLNNIDSRTIPELSAIGISYSGQ